ncbi:hypothetical protein F66182_9724 [Fusarium sp. NRRL 66182]|nr:hypothetical protein F66182_9724 [Fusarium sp. NRRL 66182]
MTQRKVQLTSSSLNEFVQHVQFSEPIHELTLVGIHHDDGTRVPKEPPATREELLELLTRGFTAIAQGDSTCLTSLHLRIDVGGSLRSGHRPKPKTELELRSTSKSAWECTNDTFFLALQALTASRLPVQSLNMFNDTDMKLFGLASDQLDTIDWDSPDVVHVFSSLKTLSANISTPVFAFRQTKGQNGNPDWLGRVTEWTGPQVRAEAEKESNFDSLARLVQKCPRLEDFEYRWLGIPLPGLPDLKGFTFPGWKILHYLSQASNLPKLKRCTFRHQITRDSDVLEFIKRTKPTELFMGPMWLDLGKFKPILDYCTTEEASMEKVDFRGPLYQLEKPDLGQVHFQQQEYDEDAECSAHLIREGDGLRRPIYHHLDPQGFVKPGSTFCKVVGESKAHMF